MSNEKAGRRFISRSLLLLTCLALPGVAGAQTAVAGAAKTSAAGSYTMSYWLTDAPAHSYPLILRGNGRFTITTPLLKAGGTWKESSDIVTLTTAKVRGDHWTYTARQAGANLGSQSQSGTVILDGKRWPARWYAVRNALSTRRRTHPTASPTAPVVPGPESSPPAITSGGRLLWNLEALLRATFGDSQPSSSDLTATGPTNPSNPPPNSRTGPYLNFNCAGSNCSPLSTYSPYWYTFSDPTDSAFHLSQQNYVGWSFGNYPEPVLINGKMVACDPQETTFLIEYTDASSFTLACMAPQSRD